MLKLTPLKPKKMKIDPSHSQLLHSNGSHHFFPGSAPINGSPAHTPATTNSNGVANTSNGNSNNINNTNNHMLFDLRATAEQQLGQVRRHTHDWQGSYPPSSFEQGGALLNNSATEACKLNFFICYKL